MKQWISAYIQMQKTVLDSIPPDAVAGLIERLRAALLADKHIFVFGNGGSGSNASHFVTDLGKGSSDKVGRRFRCLCLNDNVSWMTAIGNDYTFDDIFVRQLENYGKEGDLVLAMSVSGNSPNIVKAVYWANQHGLETIALVGGKRGVLGESARHVISIHSTHYGRVEDAHMAICHILCYAFMEHPEWGKA
jgi:D-sedoheptulose 7-phosphate isomerase